MNTLVHPIPENVVLEKGSHDPDGQYCIMELVAYVAGEAWTDAPACVAPTLAAYCLKLNDRAPDDVRQRLLTYVPRLIGTAPESFAVQQQRAYLAADRACRVFAPAALDAQGWSSQAEHLRTLSPVIDTETAAAAHLLFRNTRHLCLYSRAAAYAATAARAASIDNAAGAVVCAAYAVTVWDDAFTLLDDVLAPLSAR